jgi:hypothetical protein
VIAQQALVRSRPKQPVHSIRRTDHPKSSAVPAPEQSAPAPPRVVYENGLLTIVAENAPLEEILEQLRVSTGAAVATPGPLSQRVTAHLGPAPAAQVVSDLLHDLGFNYVIVGAPMQSILLAPRSAAPAAPSVPDPAAAARAEALRQQAILKAAQTGGDEGVDDKDH